MIQKASVFLSLMMAATIVLAQGLPLPGGEHDSDTSGFTIYSQQPVEGLVPDTTACKLTARHIELVNSQKAAEISRLFADDAFIFEPAHESVVSGRGAIDNFFSSTIGPMSPKVTGVSYVGSDRDCVVAIALETRWNERLQHTLVSLDLFTLGDSGTFSRMIAFTRSMPDGMLPSSIPPEMVPLLKRR